VAEVDEHLVDTRAIVRYPGVFFCFCFWSKIFILQEAFSDWVQMGCLVLCLVPLVLAIHSLGISSICKLP
jgi:hypothetical protein